MGYVSKEELMLKLKESCLFNEDELHAINKRVEKHNELEGGTILKLWAINEMEQLGILRRFYKVCKRYGYFPDWLRAVEEGKDHID